MAASIKISELNSLTDLTDVDLFLVSDMETGTSRKISYNNLKSNVISDAISALSDLENVVSQNQTDFDARINVLETDPVTKTYVDNKVSEVIGGAPEALDSLSELADAMGDNPNLITDINTRVTALEVDPTTQADVDAVNQSLTTSLGSLSNNVTQNATDISALQTTIGNLDIDIAPETLNSIDELAQALGDDPQIITNLQSQLTDYIAHIEARNLEAALAEGTLYADTLFGG